MSRVSFVPPIPPPGPPSRLAGNATIKVIVDRKSLAACSKELDSVVRASAKATALELSHRAIDFLSAADRGAGHMYLASRWTNTRPVVRTDGTVEIQVWNTAENDTFYTKSNAPNSRYRYPISGKRVLNFLLNGVKPHEISARSPRNPLQFAIVSGQRQSMFGGTAMTVGGLSIGRMLNPNRPNAVFRGLSVQHPGMTPNRFLQAAKGHIEVVARNEGADIAGRVAASVSAGQIGRTF